VHTLDENMRARAADRLLHNGNSYFASVSSPHHREKSAVGRSAEAVS
jgi:hypothetical protein